MNSQVIQKIKTAPKNPGVYIFYRNQTPLYIGKASNLKNRLQNYLPKGDYSAKGGPAESWKTEALHREANRLKIIKMRSNIEALIEESKLIKTLKPKLNILWRDDKNYFYAAITREKFPKIYLTHQPHLESRIQKVENRSPKILDSRFYLLNSNNYIGPFTDGQSIKAILRLLRKFFPYCACFQPHYRLCLNAQIGNCLGYCCQRNANIPMRTNDANTEKYQKNIRKIKNILTGKDKKFIRQLKDPYELLVLEKIQAHQPYLESRIQKVENRSPKILDSRFYLLDSINKVECYDNSHLSGKEAVGAMTAWQRVTSNIQHPASNWLPEKPLWRKFKIRGNYTEDDPRMIKEIISRRLNHPEWPYPDLIIIDGGITQLNAAKKALQKAFSVQRSAVSEKNNALNANRYALNPKIISFAKPQKLVHGWENQPVSLKSLPKNLKKLITLAIGQTHNYARKYHRQIRQKNFLNL